MKVRNLQRKIEQRLNELLVQGVELNISLTENNMREIIYRAYVKHLQIIIEVQRINFDCKTVEGYIVHPDEGDMNVFCFEDVHLTQYTGLKDKNGKEIWEGDVALIFGISAEIRYSDTWCGWVFFCRQKPKELQELPFYDGENGNYKECEIIGNIYELS